MPGGYLFRKMGFNGGGTKKCQIIYTADLRKKKAETALILFYAKIGLMCRYSRFPVTFRAMISLFAFRASV